ncbi:MAG: substrate-binding periplasmic protein [Coriobacteriales bacterium]|jgi:polar amino acid transport system substrate-binding protein
MKKNLLVRVAAVVAVVALCAFAAGCAHTTGSKEVKVEPQVAADALVAADTLTVGIDSTLSPFGGESEGQVIGVDVDVAAALASELGLNLQVVDTAGKNAVTMINDGEIDMAMNISPTQSRIAVIGPYLDNGPVLFGKDVIANLDDVKGKRVGATTGSLAASTAIQYCGADNIAEFPSIAEAFDAFDNGQVDYVASDAVAGGYLALTSHEGVVYSISLANPSGTYIGVGQNNTELQTAVTNALKAITGNGVLQTVAAKWTGVDCAEHIIMAEDQITTAKIEQNKPNDEPVSDDDDEESSDEDESSDEE